MENSLTATTQRQLGEEKRFSQNKAILKMSLCFN